MCMIQTIINYKDLDAGYEYTYKLGAMKITNSHIDDINNFFKTEG